MLDVVSANVKAPQLARAIIVDYLNTQKRIIYQTSARRQHRRKQHTLVAVGDTESQDRW